jgi:hypothetical protein
LAALTRGAAFLAGAFFVGVPFFTVVAFLAGAFLPVLMLVATAVAAGVSAATWVAMRAANSGDQLLTSAATFSSRVWPS